MPEQSRVAFEFPQQNALGGVCTASAWARVPQAVEADQRRPLMDQIAQQLRARGATLVAHYYVDGWIQDLAWETGGFVGDSLEMARFGRNAPSETLVVAGVRFMGETAKILSPNKTILMPDLEATCSLDLGCPPNDFSAFCDAHPDRTVLVYANTSAAVKARADWMVTSSCALAIVRYLQEQGQKILFAPDRHLGRYISDQTGADMLLWEGHCVVHDEFKAAELEALRRRHPGAKVLVHPESPAAVVALADVVGSTTALIKAVTDTADQVFIVATDQGILHRMRQLAPGKTLLEAPTAGTSATCKSCANCPWMAMNGLLGIQACLNYEGPQSPYEVLLDPAVGALALRCVDRMLAFTAAHPERLAQAQHGFVSQIGSA